MLVNTRDSALSLIRDLRALLQATQESVLAESDDAAFFRQKRKASVALVSQALPVVSAPKFEIPLPLPPAAPTFPKPPKAVSAPPSPPVQLAPTPSPISTPHLPISSLRTLVGKLAPELAILEEIPSDVVAKKMASRWKTKNQVASISVLCFQETNEQRALLEEIARALDVYFGDARLIHSTEIERDKQWDTFLSGSELKLVIACDSTLWNLPNLRALYREIPAEKKRLLKEKPLLLLPDLSLYLKDSSLKRSLWKALCQTCRASS